MELTARGELTPTRGFGAGTGSAVIGLCLALILGATPTIALALAIARGGLSNPWILPLAAFTLCVNLLIVSLDLRYGLALFLVAAGLSPKFPGLYTNLRAEDLVFVAVFGVWLLGALRRGRLPTVRSPLTLPFLILVIMSAVSTFWGLSLGTVPDWKYSFLLEAKRVEYFLIFWIVATTVRSTQWVRLLLFVFVVSGTCSALYGLGHQEETYLSFTQTRVTGPHGENYNTLAGYLVLCIGVGIALPGATRSVASRLALWSSVAIMISGVLLSFSREGLIMLVGAILVFCGVRRRLAMVVLPLLTLPVLLGSSISSHVGDTLTKVREAPHDSASTNSLSDRIRVWKITWKNQIANQPLLGNGVGSTPLSVDNEYLLRASDGGIIGLGLFLWLLAATWQQIRPLLRCRENALFRSLGIGLLAGFAALLIQGLVAVSFTTIRTMEPFWFLLGLAACADSLSRPLSHSPTE